MFERDVVKSCLQVDHAYPLGSPQLCPIPSSIIQLVLIFVGLFINGHYILAHPIRLTRLLTRHQQQRSDTARLFVG